ncbi:MAG: flagellar hook assembly protein FlgD [Gammaproteobacteria bacterium]|nr:flagellar hook assembly protein FlgD [Gammaproteobacteria bacterium]
MADPINNSNPLIDQLGIQNKTKDTNKDANSLAQEDFLKLMVAQMAHQDPLKPQENGEFLGQMAQFSTVQGLQDMQKTLDSLSNSMVSNQALQASSMVGRFVRVPGDEAFLPEGEGNRFFGAVELEQSTSNVKFEVLSKSGEVLKTVGMGEQKEGVVQFAWDGTNNKGEMMEAGSYKIRASAIIDGQSTSLDTMMIAPVESVTLGRNGQQMKLNVSGIGERTMSQVREILS